MLISGDHWKEAMTDPLLDTRRFQDLLEQAQRHVAQRSRGLQPVSQQAQQALLEATAMVVDQLVYRVNQLPDRLHRSLLNLVGVQRRPPTAATVPVTIWLLDPLSHEVVIPRGTEISDESGTVVFTTDKPLNLVPISLVACAAQAGDDTTVTDLTNTLLSGEPVTAFGEQVTAGNVLLLGLSATASMCAISLTFDCQLSGIGIDPRNPPIVWEAWCGDGWLACEVERDETSGLCVSGELVLHLPRRHAIANFAEREAGWVRCRVTESEPGQPTYTASPTINSIRAATAGATCSAVHGRLIEDEPLGVSDGTPGQRFTLRHHPVTLNFEPPVIEVLEDDDWKPWHLVSTFADSGPYDRHVLIDPMSGQVIFGQLVHQADGAAHLHGECPPSDALIRAVRYWSGGGVAGNIAVGALSKLQTRVTGLPAHRVENLSHGIGGTEGESDEQLRQRSALEFRTRDRAVTAQDFEQLTRNIAPELARVHCSTADDGTIRLLLVPAVARNRSGRIEFDQLRISPDTMDRVVSFLEERRVIGVKLSMEPVSYQGFSLVCRVVASPFADRNELQRSALAALYSHFDPLEGGTDSTGWSFGRPVGIGDVYAVLERVPGIDYVDDVHIFPANPVTGRRSEAVRRIEVARYALPFGLDHQIRVIER